jgi:hypothetical protein
MGLPWSAAPFFSARLPIGLAGAPTGLEPIAAQLPVRIEELALMPGLVIFHRIDVDPGVQRLSVLAAVWSLLREGRRREDGA